LVTSGTHRRALAAEEQDAGDDDGDEPMLSVPMSITVLFLDTILVAFFSGLLVEEIREVTEEAHMNEHFIGIVLLPIIGNACEHAAAIRFAVKDKIGLSVGIAVGSSTQIALFAVPFSVLAGWSIGQPMDLNFGMLNVAVMTLSVMVVLSMVVDGQSNWLHGYLLMAAYIVISTCYWHLPSKL
jgi:Ca2+:H+ antiporter